MNPSPSTDSVDCSRCRPALSKSNIFVVYKTIFLDISKYSNRMYFNNIHTMMNSPPSLHQLKAGIQLWNNVVPALSEQGVNGSTFCITYEESSNIL